MFIYNPQRRISALTIDNNFFKIISEDDENFTVRVNYKISQSFAIRNKCNNVKITVFSKVLLPERIRETPGDPQKSLDSILTFNSRSIVRENEQNKLILGHFTSDITSKINNLAISDILAGKKPDQIEGLKKKSLKFTDQKFTKNIPGEKRVLEVEKKVSQTEITKADTIRDFNFDIITKDNIDPSTLYKEIGKEQSQEKSRRSTVVTKKDFSRKESVLKFKNHFLSTSTERISLYKRIITPDTSDLIDVPCEFKIKKSINRIIVRFELMSLGSVDPLDFQEKVCELNEQITLLRKVVTPPVVTTTPNKNNIIMSLLQKDKYADTISVYSKSVLKSKREETGYSLVGSYSLKHGETKKVSFPRPVENTIIYRLISSKPGETCPTFSSIVVPPIQKSSQLSDALIDSVYSTKPGFVTLSAKGLSDKSLSVQFLVKDGSKKRGVFENAGGLIILSQNEKTSGSCQIDFGPLKHDRIYEFSCKINYKNGITKNHGQSIFHFFDKRIIPQKETVELVNPSFVNDDFTFNFNIKNKEGNIDLTKKILSNVGDLTEFQEEIKNQKGELKSATAFRVARVNLRTGIKEDLGITADTKFSDKEMSMKSGVSAATKNDSFRYELSVLSAQPETLFSQYRKEIKDDRESKIYQYSPAKWMNNKSLIRGTIPAKTNNNLQESKSGVVLITEIIGEKQISSLKEVKVDYKTDYAEIKFTVNGSFNDFDHFVISKIINEEKIMIDSIHSQFSNEGSYLYYFSDDDIGEISFSILGIGNDYNKKGEVFSSSAIRGERI